MLISINSLKESDYIYVDGNGVDFVDIDKDDEEIDSSKTSFNYKPLDYDNYDVDVFGNLDLTKPPFLSKKGDQASEATFPKQSKIIVLVP